MGAIWQVKVLLQVWVRLNKDSVSKEVANKGVLNKEMADKNNTNNKKASESAESKTVSRTSARYELKGERFVLSMQDSAYPQLLKDIASPPKYIYGIGNMQALSPGVAIVGARKATPYGLACTKLFAKQAALRGLSIISGGAFGCDQAAHEAALSVGAQTVVVFGGAADVVYPKRGFALFQKIIDSGGVIISEHTWQTHPLPAFFVQRNRIIAGLSRLLLIVEAGLPSGTFTTADFAIKAGRDVCAVPGSISSPNSKGSNKLIFDGASPVIDEESFDSALDMAFEGAPLSMQEPNDHYENLAQSVALSNPKNKLIAALAAQPLSIEELACAFSQSASKLLVTLSQLELEGVVQRGYDGRYQVCPRYGKKNS